MIVVVCQWQYSLLGDHDLTNVHDHGGGGAVRGSRSASGRIPDPGARTRDRRMAEIGRGRRSPGGDNDHMRLAEGVVIHQVHAAKIGADVTASIVSNVLLWRERPAAAVAVRVIVPVAGSAAVLGLADLDGLSRTRRGRYVLAHMPPSALAVRLAGDALMGLGAYRRNALLLIVGAAMIGAGWSHALWPRPDGRGRPGGARERGPAPPPAPRSLPGPPRRTTPPRGGTPP